ncbi:Uncharacterised protein [Serratia fonticola]|uniref:hypothetical protein n=1 Tax=Serratia fonticola TaxID=47917 RepID=UPI0021784C8A|nr:hypothetical protein [Serratia fonticola]CAI1770446.1 Uncharacterised protein [Serratia fonticola]
MANHARRFSYAFGVNKVVSVEVSDLEVSVVVIAEKGELVKTLMSHKDFFDKKPIPGMWMVDGFCGERFFVDEQGLLKLGEEAIAEKWAQ